MCILVAKGIGTLILTPQIFIGFKCSTIDVGKNNNGWFWFD
jgi:hypothetical protein